MSKHVNLTEIFSMKWNLDGAWGTMLQNFDHVLPFYGIGSPQKIKPPPLNKLK